MPIQLDDTILTLMKARIRELLHAKPFRPFTIRMVDGREYRVENPEFVMASPKERTNVLLEESRNKMHYLPPPLIQSVEPIAELGIQAAAHNHFNTDGKEPNSRL